MVCEHFWQYSVAVYRQAWRTNIIPALFQAKKKKIQLIQLHCNA